MNDTLLLFLVILLAAAALVVPISARLGLGSVIGYLVAGVALGPQGLSLMSNPESILHFSEFGVVLLLFLIGLELHPKRLWEMRRLIFGMGTLQILVTTLALGAGLHLFGWTRTESLIAGLGLSMSSTAIAMQIIAEKHLNGKAAGKQGFAVLLFQDLAFIPILIFSSLLADKKEAVDLSTMAVQVLTALSAVAGVVLAVRYLSYPFFRWISGAKVRELSTALSLLIVLGIAYVMEHVGLSMALGTFIAGVILADSEYRHEVEANIEPFKGLLLGLFFLAIGMTIKLDLLVDKPLIVLGLLFSLLAVKILVLAGVAYFFNSDKKQIPMLAILLSQGGEFAFVLFSQALNHGTLSQEKGAVLNAVVTLSMLTTPLLVFLYGKFFGNRSLDDKPPHDVIDDEGKPVIIAGFGRMGQIVTRLLKVNEITSTVIDHNPEQIERVRKFGFKAYYGDASQLGILEAAGIRHARLLIITIDNKDTVNKLVEEIRRHYPQLKILARARDRMHAYELMDRGVQHMERETFGSSLSMGEKALVLMGMPRLEAHRTALRFQQYDMKMFLKLYEFHDNEKEFISRSREATAALEQLFAADQKNISRPLSDPEGDGLPQ